jgi:hypothetical protein
VVWCTHDVAGRLPGCRVFPLPGYRPAASSVHYTTSCKHNLVLLQMGEIIARNMLSSWELWINRYCCIQLGVCIIWDSCVHWRHNDGYHMTDSRRQSNKTSLLITPDVQQHAC